jgi:hypothetical protein
MPSTAAPLSELHFLSGASYTMRTCVFAIFKKQGGLKKTRRTLAFLNRMTGYCGRIRQPSPSPRETGRGIVLSFVERARLILLISDS